jgi:hypothetical protein
MLRPSAIARPPITPGVHRTPARRARMRPGVVLLALGTAFGAGACLPPPPVGTTCTVVGQDPPSPVPLGNLAAVGRALEARFPTCFGGIVRTGDLSADIWVVGEDPAVRADALLLAGPGYTIGVHPSDHALVDVRALRSRIDADADELHAAGIPTHQTGVMIVNEGPRVLVGLQPDTPAARAALEQRYGADWLVILDYGPPTGG